MNKFVEVAIEEALKGNQSEHFGALLIHRGKIISSGHNFTRNCNSGKRHCVLCAWEVF